MLRPRFWDQGRPVAIAASAAIAAAFAISISQYFNARFARSAAGRHAAWAGAPSSPFILAFLLLSALCPE
jgi:hypothetical protein